MYNALQSFLLGLPEGPVKDVRNLELLLVESWDSFPGSKEAGMQPQKLFHRLEKVFWKSPILTFSIERHGATVNGSTRGELQEWEINTTLMSASLTGKRVRQLFKKAERIDITAIASEIAECILNNLVSPSLQRFEDGRVKVLINTVVPSDGFKQTITTRRKRFRVELEHLIKASGWNQIGRPKDYTYVLFR